MAASRKKNSLLRELNYDLFADRSRLGEAKDSGNGNGLPSREFLERLFDLCNRRYFGGRLPQVGVEWSARMRVAGKYYLDKRIIRLGRSYHEYFPDEIEDTLKHEMIHILYPDHGPLFRHEAARIGCSIHARSYPHAESRRRYTYVCPECGEKYYRYKRIRTASCGRCSGGSYNPRYKLRLLPVAAKQEKRR